MSKREVTGLWQPTAEMNDKRRNHCRVRLHDGRELEAIWGPHEFKCGCQAWCWAASDNNSYGLFDVKEFKLLGSLPVGSLPGGECTDAELIADVRAERAAMGRLN